MKRYTIQITIEEGNDEFWESLAGKTGCDDITEVVKECLATTGFDDASIKLIKFTDEESK